MKEDVENYKEECKNLANEIEKLKTEKHLVVSLCFVQIIMIFL